MHKKIFISSPRDIYLKAKGDDRESFKHSVIHKIEELGYKLQYYNPGVAAGGSGIAEGKSWDYKEVKEIIGGCAGVVLIGLRYWSDCIQAGDNKINLVTEYCHYEGAIARTYNLPVFPLLEEGVEKRLVFSSYSGEEIFEFRKNADDKWLENSDFQIFLQRWNKKVVVRDDLFLGYSSKVESVANEIKNFLIVNYPNLKILDWKEFNQSGFILERIKQASENCTAAILLFTADELIITNNEIAQTATAIPTDNVLFEAGYFIHAKGHERVLLIAESGARIPADLGGIIYAPLQNKGNISSIHEKLKSFIAKNL